MRYIIFILLLIGSIGANAQFPTTDSLRKFNNKYVGNSPINSFTNLRLNTLLYGMINHIDSARLGTLGAVGVDTIMVLNDSTLRYKKNGTFYNFSLPSYARVLSDTSIIINGDTVTVGGTGGGSTVSAAAPIEKDDDTLRLTYNSEGLRVKDNAIDAKAKVFNSVAALRAISEGDTSSIYRVRSNKDYGEFKYDPDDASTADDSVMTLVDAAGNRFKRVLDNTFIDVRWFGALPSDGISDDVAINKAVQYIISNPSVPRDLFFPGGDYVLDAPIILYKWNGTNYDFFEIGIIGDGYNKMPASGYSTRFLPSFTDAPAIIINKARGTKIAKIAIEGDYNPLTILPTEISVYKATRAQWNISGMRDSPFSPYSGICIDPFQPTVPTDGGYPTLTDYYRGSGISGSSGIIIEQVHIKQFVVGIMVNPSKTTRNTENTDILDSRVDYCKSAVAVGQDQSLNNFVRNFSSWGWVHTVIDCYNYGQADLGTGASYPPYIDGMNIAGNVFQMFHLTINTSALFAQRINAESMFRLGVFNTGATFQSGKYRHTIKDAHFTLVGRSGNRPAADRYLVGGGLDFYNCIFEYYVGDNRGRMNFAGQDVTFSNCTFEEPPITRAFSGVTSTSISPRFYNCYAQYYGRPFGHIVRDQNLTFSANDTKIGLQGLRQRINLGTNISGDFDWNNEANDASLNFETATVTVDTLTYTGYFVSPTHKTKYKAYDYLLSYNASTTKDTLIGLTVQDPDPLIGRVSSISNDTVYIADIPAHVKSGSYVLFLNYYRHSQAMYTGDLVSGQDTIKNVEVLANVWPSVGDRIEDQYLPFGTYVKSVDQTNKKVVISQAATFSVSHRDFIMGNPNITIKAATSPAGASASTFHFNGARWVLARHYLRDSIGHQYLILRTGPYNSTLHAHKSIKILPGGDLTNGDVNFKVTQVSNSNYNVGALDHVIHYTSASASHTVTLPSAATYNNKVIQINNPTDRVLNVSTYRLNSVATATTLEDSSMIVLHSDGTEWRRIGGSNYNIYASNSDLNIIRDSIAAHNTRILRAMDSVFAHNSRILTINDTLFAHNARLVTLENTIPEEVNLIAGTNITITGTYPNLTINSSGGGGTSSETFFEASDANYTITTATGNLAINYYDALTADRTVTLPDPATNTGRRFVIRNGSVSYNINLSASVYENSTTSYSQIAPGQILVFYSNGTLFKRIQ